MVTAARNAWDTAWKLLGGGFLLAVAGFALAASQHPETTVSTFGTTDKSGSDGGYYFGLFLGGVGGCMLWVALIAFGVMLGTTAARSDNRP